MSHYQLDHHHNNENINLFTANYTNKNDFESLFSSNNSSRSSLSGTTLQSFMASKQINTNLKQSLSMPFNEINNNTLTSNFQKNIASNEVPNCTLFVGNLHPSINEHDLSELFKVFGIYQAPKCSKQWIHFGFVRYSTEKEAIQAYRALNGVKIKGRPMRLEFQNRTKKVLLEKAAAEAKQNALRSLVAQQSLTSSQSRLNLLLCPKSSQQLDQKHDLIKQTQEKRSSFNEQALMENHMFDIEQFLESSDDESEDLLSESEKSINSSDTTQSIANKTNWSKEDWNNKQDLHSQQFRRTASYNLFSSSLDFDFHSAAFGGNGSYTNRFL